MQTPSTPNSNTEIPTISFNALSFSGSANPAEESKNVYRAVQLSSAQNATHSMTGGTDFQSLSYVPSKLGNKSAAGNNDLDDIKMPSMGGMKQKPAMTGLDISYTLVVDNDAELSYSAVTATTPRIEVPALKVPLSSSFIDECCNELNSFLVDNADSFQVINSLNDILSAYDEDIDFQLDEDNKRIDGIVFLSNYSVNFIIYIHCVTPNQTRFEFRRSGGDALAASKFWAELKAQFVSKQQAMIHNQMETDSDFNQFSFVALDLDLNGIELDDDNDDFPADLISDHFTKQEIDQFTLSMVENDCFLVDELSFLYDAIMENQKKCESLLAHKPFMTQLVNHTMLNQDVCVLRFACLILERLSSIDSNCPLNVPNCRLFENATICLTHSMQFIQKYAVDLLNNLCHAPKWNMSDKARQDMINTLKIHNNQQEISQITQKLMS